MDKNGQKWAKMGKNLMKSTQRIDKMMSIDWNVKISEFVTN